MRAQSGWIVRTLALVLLVAVVVAAGVGAALWQQYQRFADAPLVIQEDRVVVPVERGDSFRRVLTRLRAAGISQAPDVYWQALAWQMDVMRRIHVGEYAIEPGTTPRQLLAKMGSGRVIQYRFTIVEGWNFRELRQALDRSESLQPTITDMDDAQVMAALGREGVHPEGRFLPETYNFTRGTTDLEVLARAMRAMDRVLEEVWEARAEALAVDSAEEALILASLIEKETGQAGERREIAGVFTRRLNIGMRLQTDPSVIYGMGELYQGRIGRAGLDTDTPYNTYTRGGLPPTPIAMPGRAALEAAVDPADGDTMYFVSRGDGSHHFSRTLAEHNRAVARYILGRGRSSTDE
ncbi:endolytic transglycosylase MltG [Alkalisalibacterium limincola]|uniref:endolytic transglycosylase MltG n=1 Tax=Alkalisalibacterium limincola TaxID=2699169 RepID=UPI002103D2F3|nr:endolytic transglycosylase MltG [Alkalisalibacterium limincola]